MPLKDKRTNQIENLRGRLLNKVTKQGLPGLNYVLGEIDTWNKKPKKKNAQISRDDLKMTLGRNRAITLFSNLDSLRNVKKIKTAWELLLPYINNPKSTSRYGGEKFTTHAELAYECGLVDLYAFFLFVKKTPSATNTSSLFQPSTEDQQPTTNKKNTQYQKT